MRRHKEPNEVYGERLSRVFYENYIGSIVDWYAATLLRREPMLVFEGNDNTAKEFYNQFSEDCDLQGNQPERILPPAVRRSAGVRLELHCGRFSRGRTARR